MRIAVRLVNALAVVCGVTALNAAESPATGLSAVWDGTAPAAVATGLRFTEGPAWDPRDGSWLFSDIPGDRLYRIAPDGVVAVFVDPAHSPNGNRILADGTRITCEQSLHRVTRTPPGAGTAVLTADFLGKAYNSPNDVCVAADGSLWFTDPTHGLGKRVAEQPCRGVYRIAPDGTVTRVIADLDQPNGIQFSPDGTTVYVGESGKGRLIRAYPVRGATVGDGRLFAAVNPGVPDGMRCDTAGRLYVGCGDGVQVFTADGTRLGTIPTPKAAANCGFGGVDRHDLLITAVDTVWRVRLRSTGLP